MSNNVTLDEMNELLDEIYHSGGDTWVEIDGQTYYTDWGYGVVAIEFFIRMLKNRKSDSDATHECRNVAEDARSLIDDEVHRDCEYYVYLQLRDCIDVIDDDYERLKVENTKLRELCRRFAEYASQDRCEGCVCKSRCNDGLIDECWQRTKIREMARELGVEADG